MGMNESIKIFMRLILNKAKERTKKLRNEKAPAMGRLCIGKINTGLKNLAASQNSLVYSVVNGMFFHCSF